MHPGRAPSSTLAIDANILLSVALGRRSAPTFARVTSLRHIVTAARTAQEVRKVIGKIAPASVGVAAALLDAVHVVDETAYAGLLRDAETVLSLAVASRNGSITDTHLLACAWTFDADVWSHDRDFAGTGWPSWSNANLAAALDAVPQA